MMVFSILLLLQEVLLSRWLFLGGMYPLALADSFPSSLWEVDGYESRKAILLNLVDQRQQTPVVQAFRGEAIAGDDDTTTASSSSSSSSWMNVLLKDLDQDRDAAFRIMMLVRIHALTDDRQVQQTIFQRIRSIPFWLTHQEHTRVYWTENQMRYAQS